MNVLIIGIGGRLGKALAHAYRDTHQVIGFTHAELDIASPEAITASVEPLDFDVLINCAALTNVDYCETNEIEAMRINSGAVRDLAEICGRKKARLIHISTDYVFDGEKKGPYTEEDIAQAISVYGESKRRGEVEVLTASDKNLIARVSWVFGPDRPSFVDLILKRALESEQVAAIGDKLSSPSFTVDIAGFLSPFVSGEVATGGLLHACNTGACSWQEYGQYAIDCAIAAGMPVKGKTVGALAMADMKNFVAKRPVNTVLSVEKLSRLTGKTPRSWQAAVEDFVTNHVARGLCKA